MPANYAKNQYYISKLANVKENKKNEEEMKETKLSLYSNI